MYRVKVENSCRCFFKSGLCAYQEFNTKSEAKDEAEYMLGIMNSSFCQKHTFELKELFDDFVIYIKDRN